MSLATRCTSCGTAFRVVQDQLKVSEGWVRCGRCDSVFNAFEGLFDLQRTLPAESAALSDEAVAEQAAASEADAEEDRANKADAEQTGANEAAANGDAANAVAELVASKALADVAEGSAQAHDDSANGIAGDATAAPATEAIAQSEASEGRWSAAPAPPASERSTRAKGRPSAPTRSDGPASQPAEHAASLDEEIDAHLFGVRALRRKTVPGHLSDRDRLDFSDARFDSDLLADAADEDDEAGSPPTTRSPELPLESSAPHPEFLRRADNRARWQRPRMRATLGVAALALLALLGLQAAHHFRDDVAARWPALEPALAQWCDVAGCKLEAPRRIDEIAVENTALAKVAGSEAFRLGVTLRSRSAMPLAMPWLDLSLTDANGRLVARRALAAGELEPATHVLQPGGEIALHAFLEAANSRVTGYTIEIFYP